jgi:DNA-binding transcriptional ArsR family regulator
MKSDGFDHLDPAGLARLAELCLALAHPVRLRMVGGLLAGECCVGPMTQCLGLPQPVVSRHLGVLRRTGVVRSRARGRERVYEVIHPAARPLIEALRASVTP